MKREFIAFCLLASSVNLFAAHKPNIYGTVTCEGSPVAGVYVSDGVGIAVTDARGCYRISSGKKNGTVFVITPSGYVAESRDGLQPGFWAPVSGDVNRREKCDFRLVRQDQTRYKVIVLTDVHLTATPEKQDTAHFRNLVMPLVRKIIARSDCPVYSFNLGDLSHDLFWYEHGFTVERAAQFLRDISYPTLLYSVSGNHDNDGAIAGRENEDFEAEHLYHKTFGPSYYSTNIGTDHWIFADDIIYRNVPGKGKKGRNIAGDRSYGHAFTEAEMAWIREDLKRVQPGYKVHICTHCPMCISDGRILFPKKQVAELQEMFAPFGEVEIYCGHSHKLDNCYNPECKGFISLVSPATSGEMWETSQRFQTLGSDGCDGGIRVLDCRFGEEPSWTYQTYLYGEKYFRVYDINTVGEYYANNKSLRRISELYGRNADYSKPEFRNMVYVNCWGISRGGKLEILEEGKQLEVEQADDIDPLYFISYYQPRIEDANWEYIKKYDGLKNYHMFRARTSSETSSVEVRFYDETGALRESRTVERPKAFDKSMD